MFGTMSAMGFKKIKSKLNKISDKPLLNFSIKFIVLFAFLMLITPPFYATYRSIFIELGNSYFQSNINKDLKLKKSVEVVKLKDNKRVFEIKTTYYDRIQADNTYPQKKIGIDIISEGLIPTILLLVLILSTPISFKRILFSLIIGFIIINLYIQFKMFAIAFDNFNSPEYAIMKLTWLISGIVYYYNYLLNVSGYSINFIIVIIIWISSTVRVSDIEKFVLNS